MSSSPFASHAATCLLSKKNVDGQDLMSLSQLIGLLRLFLCPGLRYAIHTMKQASAVADKVHGK